MDHRDPTGALFPGEGLLEAEELRTGTRIGGYVVERLIARGGGGTVYVVRHGITLDRFALKVLHGALARSPRMVERFVREVEVVKLLRHPNIVEIHEIDALPDGRPYCVMEYLDGMTLDALLREQGPLAPEDALDLLEPVCAALAAAHRAGIVHRDVKGSNVCVSFGGDRRAVKLLDFGIAKLLYDDARGAALTSAGRQMGTPSVMAPEQILGDPVDGRTDVYALGALLHKLLTGRPPFRGESPSELARQHLEEPPPRPSSSAPVPLELDAVVVRCLEKRPERRFESVRAFFAALREAVGAAPRARESVPEAIGEAVAIYVEVRVDPADDLDDELLEDVARALDRAEERLRDGGLSVVLTTGNVVLGARPLPKSPDRDGARRAALAAARGLHEELAGRPQPDPRVSIAITVHVGEALTRPGPEFVGGAVLRTNAWSAPPEASGLWATPAAVAGLVGDPGISPGPRGLVALGATSPPA
jgi:predicted Ser/Thr protein kinase